MNITEVNREAEEYRSDFLNFVKSHKFFISLISLLYVVSFYTVTKTPVGPEIPQLEVSYVLFAPSFASFILVTYIGVYLLYRYYLNPISRDIRLYQFSWGLSFLIYSILFVGLSLQALGWEYANMHRPEYFFLWRFPMIFWVSGMWVGSISLFSENKKQIYGSGLLINLVGLVWFTYGLLFEKNIEKTMYGFLFWFFIPMCFILANIWYNYYKLAKITSARMLSLGFTVLGISYAAWAPFHFKEVVYIYFIFYQIFIVSLAFILAGFYALPKEIASRSS